MRLEELHSLNEDELAMLWFIINKTTPPTLTGFELEPSLFCYIKPHVIVNRVNQTEKYIKDEYKPVYDSLRQKLNMVPIVRPVEPPITGSIEATPTSDTPTV
jgi:hypothetical protein